MKVLSAAAGCWAGGVGVAGDGGATGAEANGVGVIETGVGIPICPAMPAAPIGMVCTEVVGAGG